VLLAAVAAQWNLDFERLYRFAWADFTEHHATIGFLEDLLDDGHGTPAAVARALDDDGVLVRSGLVILWQRHKDEGQTPRLHLRVRVPDTVLRFLRTGVALEPRASASPGADTLERLESLQPAVTLREQARVHVELKRALARRERLIALIGADGSGRTTVARMAGPILRVDPSGFDALTPERMAAELQRALLAARLDGVLVVLPLDGWLERRGLDEPASSAREVALTRVLARAATPLVLITRDPTRLALLGTMKHVELRLGLPDASEQRALWEALAPAAATTQRWLWKTLGTYQLSPGAIAGAARELVGRDGRLVGDPTRVLDAVRRQLPREVGRLAERVEALGARDALVLPPEALAELDFLVSCARHRDLVYETWNFRERLSSGRALSALFHGPPGTGKTMAAAIIAGELGRELLRVDLSRVVDKYIGETEKNLGALFDHAESAQAVLLFDEADSLFAKRTEVKSSNDRYANLEVNFLLQRIERYEGICILTTNFIESLDEALQRRIAVKVKFPMPTASERARLWRGMIPEAAPTEPDIDWKALGDRFELAGGHIKNAVMRAAFAAAEAGQPIGIAALWRGGAATLRELGRLVTADMASPPKR